MLTCIEYQNSRIVVSPDAYETTIFYFTFNYLVGFSLEESEAWKPPQVSKVRKLGCPAAGCGSRVGNGGAPERRTLLWYEIWINPQWSAYMSTFTKKLK